MLIYKEEKKMSKEIIKDFYGKQLGSLEDEGGKIVARDFHGRIVSSGNTLTGLIAQAAAENK